MIGGDVLWLKPARQPGTDRGEIEDLHKALYRHRASLAPIGVGTFLLGAGYAVPHPYLALALSALGTWYALYQGFGTRRAKGAKNVPAARATSLVRRATPARRYQAACIACAGLWHAGATWHGVPGPRAVLALAIMTGALGIPWWRARRIRGSVPVRFHESMDRTHKRRAAIEARALLDDWTGFSSAAQMNGSKLLEVTFTQWSILLRVRFRRGMAVEDFTTRRLAKLESAFGDVRKGSSRVERLESSAQQAVIRLMLGDPHASPIRADDADVSWTLGVFETGDPVEFLPVNTLVAGATDAGKSGIVNALIKKVMRDPRYALLLVDMKPGGPELRRYEGVAAHPVATTPGQVADLFAQLFDALTRRGEELGRRGIRTWVPTEDEPGIVLVIDEAYEIKVAKLGGQLDRLTALMRYAGCFAVIATQYPTDSHLPAGVKINCSQRIGLKTNSGVADRVIFDDDATKDGWRTSQISAARKGSFYIRNAIYTRPILARGYLVTDDEADADVKAWRGRRTLIDGASWPNGGSELDAETLTPGHEGKDTGDVVDAVLVDYSPGKDVPALSAGQDPKLADVVAAIAAGHDRRIDIGTALGLSRATVYRRVSALISSGDVVESGGRLRVVS